MEANFFNTRVAPFSHRSGIHPQHLSHVLKPRAAPWTQNGGLWEDSFLSKRQATAPPTAGYFSMQPSPRHSGWASVPSRRWLVGPAGVGTGGLFQLVQQPGAH